MPTTVQFRRGTTVQHSTFTGALGEVTVDTTQNALILHDGSTVGGFPLLKQSTFQPVFDKANAASSQANTANTNAVNAGTYANAAFSQANTANTNAVNAGTYANAAFDKANSANVIAQSSYDTANTKFNSAGGTISGDTTITGNLIINGTTTTVNTSTVSTSDSLLKLANNNTAGDSLDIGFYGTYNATGQKYAGLVRQAGSNFFLFKDLTTDPTANALAVGSLTASNTATLRANITGGTVSSLASAIGVADGGTGATTLTAGGILIGSGTSAVTILANTGTAGTYANASHVPVITTDTYGRVSAVTNTAIAIDTAAITSGTLADARLPATGTAGTYANASHVPVITTDAYGRVTAVTNTIIQIANTQITGTIITAQIADSAITTAKIANGAIVTIDIADGNVTAAKLANTAVTAGVYGGATAIPVVTVDAQGRITSASNVAVSSGTTITDDTTTNATRYPMMSTATTGSISAANTSSTKLTFNPSTGTLSATIFTATSDANAKTNIQPLENATNTVKQIQGVSFDWKDTGKASYGVIAQEIEKVLPSVVHTNPDGGKAVDYNTIIAFLIESIKEQEERIKQLESKLN
jgi:hypothetical protein